MPEQIKRWLSEAQAGKRLGLGAYAIRNAVEARIIAHLPKEPGDKGYRIPIDAPGRLLATVYNCWPPEDRPVYTQEELETLSAISVNELARQSGSGRSGTYERVKKGRIPRVRIGDRYCVPEDVLQRMHDRAYRGLEEQLQLGVRSPDDFRRLPDD
jgi:excisionase family DNA binding protein